MSTHAGLRRQIVETQSDQDNWTGQHHSLITTVCRGRARRVAVSGLHWLPASADGSITWDAIHTGFVDGRADILLGSPVTCGMLSIIWMIGDLWTTNTVPKKPKTRCWCVTLLLFQSMTNCSRNFRLFCALSQSFNRYLHLVVDKRDVELHRKLMAFAIECGLFTMLCVCLCLCARLCVSPL